MSRRDTLIALRHMLDYARESIELAQGKTRQDLDDDRTFNLAQARLLEIVGEAANRIPKQVWIFLWEKCTASTLEHRDCIISL